MLTHRMSILCSKEVALHSLLVGVLATDCQRNLRQMALAIRGNLIPKLSALRRVPPRYRDVLPLKVMKQYQCAVVGSAQGVLTIAITDRYNSQLIETLEKITGHRVFPVLAEPSRMRLLIRHLEYHENFRYCKLKPLSFLHPHITQTLVLLLT
jgi:hypothetical protein